MAQKTIDYIRLVVLSSIFQKLIALCGILFSFKYGTPTSQGEILRHETTVTSVLFISREAFRKTAPRCNGSSPAVFCSIEYLGKLAFIIYSLVYVAMYVFWSSSVTKESMIVCAAGMFEILIEPFVLRTFVLQKPQRKVRLETISSTVRTVVNCVFLTRTDPVWAYIFGRCAYALIHFVGYSYFVDEEPIFHENKVKATSETDPGQVSWRLQRECLCNMLLSESENLTVLYFLDKHDIRIFITMNTIVSFISRVVFKVVEETCDVSWPQNAKTHRMHRNLSYVIRVHALFCTLLTIGLITHPMHILSILRCPAYPSDIFAVQLCFLRIPMMGINGVLESFFRSYASVKLISQRQFFIEFFVAFQVLVYYVIAHSHGFRYVMYCSVLFLVPRMLFVFNFLASQAGKTKYGLQNEKEFFFGLIAVFLFFVHLSEHIRNTAIETRTILPHLSLAFLAITVSVIVLREFTLIINLCSFSILELRSTLKRIPFVQRHCQIAS